VKKKVSKKEKRSGTLERSNAPGQQKCGALDERVSRQVQKSGKRAERTERQAEAGKPHVFDARERQQPFEMRLREKAETAHGKRRGSDDEQKRITERGADR